jgi:hypothetical protein
MIKISELRQRLFVWKVRRFPRIPHRYCLLNPRIGGFVLGIAVGSVLVWAIYVPPTPWMHFNWVIASYERGIPTIYLDGEYEIVRECPVLLRARVVWRAQLIAPDGHVMIHVPGGAPPPLTVGVHRYQQTMSLLSEMEPTTPGWKVSPIGWRVLFIATCPGEMPETVPSPLVTIVAKHADGDPGLP